MKLIHILFLNLIFAFSISVAHAKTSDYSDKKEVKIFINEMVKKHKFKKRYLETLFAEAKVYDSILEAIARPAEGKPWYQYRPIFVTKNVHKVVSIFGKRMKMRLHELKKNTVYQKKLLLLLLG